MCIFETVNTKPDSMERQLQLQYCRQCKYRHTDLKKGLLCSLTGEKATFEGECPDYLKDETIIIRDTANTYSDAVVDAQDASTLLTEDTIENLKLDQNLSAGLLAAVVVGLIGSLLWAVISVVTQYQIGFMAMAIGGGVGLAMRYFGRGISLQFGIAGAAVALLSSIFGNVLMVIGLIAQYLEMGYWETFNSIEFSTLLQIMGESFRFQDIIFYGLALSMGYKFSFRNLTKEVIEKNQAAIPQTPK